MIFNVVTKRQLFVVFLMILLSLCLYWGINRVGSTDKQSLNTDLQSDSIRNIWRKYYFQASHDSLIDATYPFLQQAIARNDTLSVIMACAYMAQSYVFLDNPDSVAHYLSYSKPYLRSCKNSRLLMMLENVEGIYSVKFELNYPKALACFLSLYESAKKQTDVTAQVLALTNIVTVFYLMSDKYGMEYANKAYELISDLYNEPDCSLYIGPVYLSLARMYYLNDDFVNSWRFLNKTDSLVRQDTVKPLIPAVDLLRADVCNSTGRMVEAGKYYKSALENAMTDDVGLMSLIYLNYGRYFEKNGLVDQAISLYKAGLSTTDDSHNIMFKNELLRRLADLHYETENRKEFLYYSRYYQNFQDTVAFREMEQEFNALLLTFQKSEYKVAMQAKELAVVKANRNTIVAYLTVLMVLIVLLSLYLLYVRQKKMYSILMEKHQVYLQRLNRSNELNDVNKEESAKILFVKADKLVRSEQLFKKKDLTLDKLAELLETNRTYLSKAINTYSGMSFSNYINMIRINEATAIISDPSRNTLIKQLADDLGYNSVAVFSKAFQKETGMSPSRYKKEVLSKTDSF